MLIVSVVQPRLAAACDCKLLSPCESVLHSSAVFVGRVVRIEDPNLADSRPILAGRRVTLHVTGRYYGATEADIVIFTGIGGGDCGYPFVVGSTYLVYGSTSPNGSLSTSICAHTQLFAAAGSDLEYLHGLTTAPPAAARAFGRAMSAGKPYKGARIFLESSGRPITAVSGTDGKFELRGPPGVYRLRVEIPSATTASAPAAVILADSRGCGTITVSVQVAKLR